MIAQSVCSKTLTTDTPEFAQRNELWGAWCKLNVSRQNNIEWHELMQVRWNQNRIFTDGFPCIIRIPGDPAQYHVGTKRPPKPNNGALGLPAQKTLVSLLAQYKIYPIQYSYNFRLHWKTAIVVSLDQICQYLPTLNTKRANRLAMLYNVL